METGKNYARTINKRETGQIFLRSDEHIGVQRRFSTNADFNRHDGRVLNYSFRGAINVC